MKTMSHYGEESSRSCGDGCSMCCSKFWQSIPYATLVFHTVTLIGVIGFAVAGAQGTVALAGVPHLEHTVSIFGPTIAVVSGVSFFPLILTFIFAVYATGYIREVIKGHILTTCLGYSCSVFSIILLLLFALVWVLVCVALAFVITVYLEISLACQQVLERPGLNDAQRCLPTATLFNVTSTDICKGSGLDELCEEGTVAGIAFSVSFGFALLVTFDLIVLLVIQTCNFVKVREVSHYHNTYDISDS